MPEMRPQTSGPSQVMPAIYLRLQATPDETIVIVVQREAIAVESHPNP